MSDDRPPSDPDDHAGGQTDPTDDPAGTDPDDHTPIGPDDNSEPESGGLSDRAAFWISAVFATVLSVGSIAIVSGWAPFFEELLRVRPTVEGGGVGADWVIGNTEPILEWLIVLVHFADVVLGIFILVMVFLHWAAFRRLAARMQPPDARTQPQETATATDGGTRTDGWEFGTDGVTDTDRDAADRDNRTIDRDRSEGDDHPAGDGPGGDRP